MTSCDIYICVMQVSVLPVGHHLLLEVRSASSNHTIIDDLSLIYIAVTNVSIDGSANCQRSRPIFRRDKIAVSLEVVWQMTDITYAWFRRICSGCTKLDESL